MKTNFLSKVLILSLFVSCFSCDNDNVTENPNLKQLELKFNDYNSNFIYSSDNQYQGKKPWWEKVLTVAAIAVGDAGGAAAGVGSVQVIAGVAGAATAGTGYVIVSAGAGIIGAAGGSYAAYKTVGGLSRGSNNPDGSFNNINPVGNSIVFDLPNNFNYIENFGLLHNDALEKIYFSGNDSVTKLQWIERNIANINTIDYVNVYSSTEFQSILTNITKFSTNYRNNNNDYKILIDDYKSGGMMNETVSSVLSSFFEAATKSQTFNDTENITEFYVRTVESSSLKSKDKEAIFAALVVYIQSYYYWYNFEIQE